MDRPFYPGDQQAPGICVVPGAKPIPLDQVEIITELSVVPILYTDAKLFPAALGGKRAQRRGIGGLTIPGRTDPSVGTAALALDSIRDRKPPTS